MENSKRINLQENNLISQFTIEELLILTHNYIEALKSILSIKKDEGDNLVSSVKEIFSKEIFDRTIREISESRNTVITTKKQFE